MRTHSLQHPRGGGGGGGGVGERENERGWNPKKINVHSHMQSTTCHYIDISTYRTCMKCAIYLYTNTQHTYISIGVEFYLTRADTGKLSRGCETLQTTCICTHAYLLKEHDYVYIYIIPCMEFHEDKH